MKDLPFEIAKKPKSDNQAARDVKTYLAADVDAVIARLAAPEPEPVDPRWREVETGARYTATTAMARYPHLNRVVVACRRVAWRVFRSGLNRVSEDVVAIRRFAYVWRPRAWHNRPRMMMKPIQGVRRPCSRPKPSRSIAARSPVTAAVRSDTRACS